MGTTLQIWLAAMPVDLKTLPPPQVAGGEEVTALHPGPST
jgi:hypothetical protein